MGIKIHEILIPIINEREYKIIAEIGVDTGGLTRRILEGTSLKQYWAIDPWKKQEGNIPGWGRLAGCSQKEWDKKAKAVVNFPFPELSVLRMTSLMASKVFRSYYFDMVFIDAVHSYKNTKQDIRIWEPLIRPGGVLCGHDYRKRFKGVVDAVDELIGKDLKLLPATVWLKEICD